MPFDWTEKRMAILTKLWNEGMTSPEIAAHFGVTKRSVLGKANRLGLPKRGKVKSAPKKKKVVTFTGRTYKPYVGTKHQSYGTPTKPADIEKNQCHFPIGDPKDSDFHYCGAEVHKMRYCARHYKACYHTVKNYEENPCREI